MSCITQDTYFTDFCRENRERSYVLEKEQAIFGLQMGLNSKTDIEMSVIGNSEYMFPEKQYAKGGWICRYPQGSLNMAFAGEGQS